MDFYSDNWLTIARLGLHLDGRHSQPTMVVVVDMYPRCPEKWGFRISHINDAIIQAFL